MPGPAGPLGSGLSPRVRGNLSRLVQRAGEPRSIPACAGEPAGGGRASGGARVYPRVCGGTPAGTIVLCDVLGLSPRVRGNHGLGLALQQPLGSIPACAGEPPGTAARIARQGVYPRVCGGTLSLFVLSLLVKGLSPRVRGNRSGEGAGEASEGSIPACAGEPCPWAARAALVPVYPRVCGGTAVSLSMCEAFTGLSPRVRGNLLVGLDPRQRLGSIPACAGEPPRAGRRAEPAAVYPRVCGGTWGAQYCMTASYGLSPRVRGNHCRHPVHAGGGGSIPACAGEPDRRRHDYGHPAVYPRVCGGTRSPPARLRPPSGLSPRVRGTSINASVSDQSPGLSPRVRGNLDVDSHGAQARGSIPACAGEPLMAAVNIESREVYPRVCGGTPYGRAKAGPPSGLSPRVRGNLPTAKPHGSCTRSIPACAGEPPHPPRNSAPRRVYPRVCGGTRSVRAVRVSACGLSPRVRGNRVA